MTLVASIFQKETTSWKRYANCIKKKIGNLAGGGIGSNKTYKMNELLVHIIK